MSLLFLEGFDGGDVYDVAADYHPSVPSNNAVVTTDPRTGTSHWHNKNTSGRIGWTFVNTDPTFIIGFGLASPGSIVADDLLLTYGDNGATEQFVLHQTVTGALKAFRGSTEIGSSDPNVILPSGVWQYVEVKVLISDTVGTVDIYVDGVNVLSLSGVDTKNGGTNAYIDKILIYGGATYIDDLYIANTVGTAWNDVVGPIGVDTLLPNGNGNYSQLVGSDADSTDNYLQVDEATPSDADYNGSATVGQKDTYSFDDLVVATASIYGVEVRAWAHASDAGAKSIRNITRRATTDTAGSDIALGVTSKACREIWEEDPVAAAAWTVANLNATEFGAEVRT